jgi:peptidoglycan/LPS O-acetylase OafA/YrhL
MVALIVPVALFLSIAFATVGVAQVISDGRTRRRLVESNASPEMAAAIVAPPRKAGHSPALSWGVMLGSIGLALIIVQFLPYDEDDPIVAGIVLVAASIGLLGSYAMERRGAAAQRERARI